MVIPGGIETKLMVCLPSFAGAGEAVGGGRRGGPGDEHRGRVQQHARDARGENREGPHGGGHFEHGAQHGHDGVGAVEDCVGGCR